MKILHLNFDDLSGGASRAVLRLNKALNEKKIYSKIFVIKNNLKSKSIITFTNYFYLKILLKRIISFLVKKFDNFNDINVHRSYNFFNNSKLVNFINNSSFNIIHLHWINGEMISINDLYKLKKPIVWTFHDMWPVLPSSHTDVFKSKKKKFFGNSLILKKKKFFNNNKNISIIVPSKFMYQKIIQKKMIKKSNIKIIPNIIDINFWKLHNKKLSRKKLNLPISKNIIGYHISGKNDDFIKGTDMFFKILKKFSHNSNYLFLLFGNVRKDFKNYFNKNIINYGKILDDKFIRNIYNSSDLIISTSRFESFGQVMLEAQSCGTCCIAFNKTGIDDIITNEKTGYLIKQFKINNFVKKINQHFKNKEKFERYYCRKTIIKKFNDNEIIKYHENNYINVLKNYIDK